MPHAAASLGRRVPALYGSSRTPIYSNGGGHLNSFYGLCLNESFDTQKAVCAEPNGAA